MVRASTLLRRRAHSAWAITLGAASLAGQVLLAADPPPAAPQAIVNEHVQTAAARPTPPRIPAPIAPQHPAVLRSVGIEEVSASPLDTVAATVAAMSAEAEAKPAEPKLIEARPLPLRPAPAEQLAPVVLPGMVRSPFVPQRPAAPANPLTNAAVRPAVAEEEPARLAPIVPSWALPKPAPRPEPMQNSEFRKQNEAPAPIPAALAPMPLSAASAQPL